MEIRLENKKAINIIAISGIILLLIVYFLDFNCIFKTIFNIPCISCGLTRGFIYILKLDLINAIKMNLLSIPLFITIIIFYVLYFLWILLKKEYIFKYYNYIIKYYKLIIIILIINWIYNVIKYIY
ncbi:MAG: DUF2752 domain-containing protein [Bacilli bacterium]|nr:DUF2752 domain-containing protein [Bacilli bacterium]